MRIDNRKVNEIRPVQIIPDFTIHAEGSVLMNIGLTKVLCNLTIEEEVPRWMKVSKKQGGWVTAEYSMLPRATETRSPRETQGLSGRTHEIKRLIGRSLRAAVDLEALGPRTCILDCDVIQADGGTRTASITGGYVALAIGLSKLIHSGVISRDVFLAPVAAISTGIIGGVPLLDLAYNEDLNAEVDANFVLNRDGNLIEIQITAEEKPFSRNLLDQMLELANIGVGELFAVQKAVLSSLDEIFVL